MRKKKQISTTLDDITRERFLEKAKGESVSTATMLRKLVVRDLDGYRGLDRRA